MWMKFMKSFVSDGKEYLLMWMNILPFGHDEFLDEN